MPELGTYGSVRGVFGNVHPYRNQRRPIAYRLAPGGRPSDSFPEPSTV